MVKAAERGKFLSNSFQQNHTFSYLISPIPLITLILSFSMSRIILFRGKAGVGKSTLSLAVAKELKLAVLHKNDIYDSLYEHIPEHQARNSVCDTIIRRILTKHLLIGADIVLDHSLHYPNQIQSFQQWVAEQGGELQSILVTCSDEAVWRARFNQRKLDPAPNQRILDFEELKQHYGTLHTESVEGELVLDTARELNDLTQQAVHWIQKS